MYTNGVNVPDYYPCAKCGYTYSDPKNTRIINNCGKKTIYVTYKCRNCGHEFEVKAYEES